MASLHSSPADRNLLFGILALQMDFIDREALVKAMNAWVLDKTKPLGHILRDQGSLGQDELTLLEALVVKHLEKHGNDPEKSLAAVNSLDTSMDELKALSDTDVQASLVRVGEAKPSEDHPTCADPYSTHAYGNSISVSVSERYRVLRPHAKGGLGQVSVALDQELHREVALKEIQNQYADNPDNRARFLVEAEITGRLEHPGIVPVYGLGQYADGRPYYAMRFIRGDNLKEAVKRYHEADGQAQDPGKRAIEFRQLLGRFLDVCNAMAYAHARGVLHRDLKPGNIMLGQFGETLVVDWGLAKLVTQKEAATTVHEQPLALSGSSSGSAETIAGSAVGTPQFMSPEQAEGRLDLLGPASDVYSLGATLYYVLTNKSPFEDPEVGTVLKKVARGEFPAPCQVKQVPRALEAVCLKAMALKPEDRYASPRALADDIEHWLADEPVSAWKEPASARAMRWARRHRTLVAAVGVLLIAAVAALSISTFLISREKAHTEEKRAEAVVEHAKAQINFEKAQKLAEENRRQLVRIYVSNGVRLLDDGKPEQAVVWFAEALALDQEHPDKVAMHRLRLAAAMQRCAKIKQILWHNGPVTAAEFSPDGRHIVTASEDGTAQIWDAETGRPGEKLPHKDTVRNASFSPDGLRVVTASSDQTAVIWDTANGKPLLSLPKHGDLVHRAVYSPDGRRVATVSKDKYARVWDADTGKNLAEFKHNQFVYFAAFSPDGTRLVTASAGLVTGSPDKAVQVWDVGTAKELTQPLSSTDYVMTAAFSPDGERIVTGAKNGFVVIREVKEPTKPLGVMTLTDPVDRVSFVDNGSRILTVSAGAAQLWEAATAKRVPMTAKAHWQGNPSFSQGGRYRLILSSHDHAARLRDEATGKPRSLATGKVESASLSRGAHRVAAVGLDKVVRVWDTASSKPLSLDESASVTRVWLSPDENLVLGLDKQTARIWDAHTGKPLTGIMRHDAEISFAAFSPSGRSIVTASNDKTVRTWDTTTGKVRGEFREHTDVPLHAAFSPDEKLVVSSGQDNKARLWDAATGKPSAVPPLDHPSWARYAAFSADGKYLVTTSSKSAYVWDVGSGKKVCAPLKHSGKVAEASFSPDGRKIVTVSDDTGDRAARVWNAASGEPITPPLEHKEIVKHARFSSDGLLVLTATDRYARLWDAATGEAVTSRLEHDNLLDAAFDADDRGVVTVGRMVGKDGSVRMWDLPLNPDRSVAELIKLSQLTSGYRIDPVQGMVPCSPAMLKESWTALRETDDFRCPAQTVLAWHGQEAESAERASQWKESLLHLDALVKAEPAQADLHVRCGKAHEELGQWDKALAAYSQALARKADDAYIHFKRGRAHARLGKLDNALIDYKNALDLRPEDGAMWLARHLVHAQQGKTDAAKDDYEKAVLNSPLCFPRMDATWNGRNLGLAPFVSPYWKEVSLDYASLIKSGKTDWWLWRGRALAQGVLRDWKSAADDFKEAASLKGDDWRSWQGRARAFAEILNWAEVDIASRRVLRAHPEDWGTWYLLGISQKERKDKDLREAIKSYTQAIERGGNGWGIRFERGLACNEVFDHHGAIENYTEVLKSHNADFIYNNRANAYLGLKDFDAALADYAEAIRLNPKLGLNRTNRGLLYEKMGEPDKAMAEYEEAIRVDPKYFNAYQRKGALLIDRSEYAKAVEVYSKALEVSPFSALAFAQRARCYKSLEEYDRAIFDYSEAIKLNPVAAATYRKGVLECQRLALEKRLPAVLNGEVTPAADLLVLADICRRDMKRYRDASELYAMLFSAEPKMADDLEKSYRYDAACYATLAAAGQGVGADQLDAKEKTRLRKRALNWLLEDLAAREKLLAENRLAAVKIKRDMLHWQADTDLLGIRDEKELAKLPTDEKAALTQFWADVQRLSKEAASNFVEKEFKGSLKLAEKEKIHPIKLTAGKTYVIDLESTEFDPLLRIVDEAGNVVAENDDINYPTNLNSRITFTAPADGAYRLVATSYQQRGVGAYTMPIREFAPKKRQLK